MTAAEKRRTDTAAFRKRIDEQVEYLRRPISEGGLAMTKYQADVCLAFARSIIRALRELEAAESQFGIARATDSTTLGAIHPDDCICIRCDYRPEVDRSVEEVRGL